MLEWEIKNGDDKLKEEIKRTKETFDKWFNSSFWNKKYTKEQFLSKDCPVPHVRHKMILPFDKVKELYPLEAKERCSDCGDYVDKWIEISKEVGFEFIEQINMKLQTRRGNGHKENGKDKVKKEGIFIFKKNN